jgi:histidinol-phosphate aminotransferase
MRAFDPQCILREELGDLKAYSPSPGNYEVRLDANEAPDLLSVALKKRLTEVAGQTDYRRYPDAGQRDLRKAIAAHSGVDADRVICGVGSDELITMLLTAATRLKSKAPAPTLVTTTPTFVMYRLSARARGQRVMEVPLDQDWDIDDVALLRAVDIADPNVIFIASPNNPTGTMATAEKLENLAKEAAHCLIVVDEAYIDYADRHQMGLLDKYENVVILRTLSKIGFAALRVGWMIGSPALVAEIDKVRLPYNLPTLSQELATTVLSEFGEELQGLAKSVVSERTRVASVLGEMTRVHPIESQANFIWLGVDKPAGEVFAALGKEGILVRSFHGRGGRLEHFLRVTIGTAEENDRFLTALAKSV